jgi:hypothetical protein
MRRRKFPLWKKADKGGFNLDFSYPHHRFLNALPRYHSQLLVACKCETQNLSLEDRFKFFQRLVHLGAQIGIEFALF